MDFQYSLFSLSHEFKKKFTDGLFWFLVEKKEHQIQTLWSFSSMSLNNYQLEKKNRIQQFKILILILNCKVTLSDRRKHRTTHLALIHLFSWRKFLIIQHVIQFVNCLTVCSLSQLNVGHMIIVLMYFTQHLIIWNAKLKR